MNKSLIVLKLIILLTVSFCASNISINAQNAPLMINEVTSEISRLNPNNSTEPGTFERILIKFNRPISIEKAKPTDTDTELSFLKTNPGIFTILRRSSADGSITALKISSVSAHCCIKEWLYLFPIVTAREDVNQTNSQFILIIDDSSKVIFKKPISVMIDEPLRNTSGDEIKSAEQKQLSNRATFDIRPSKSKDDSNIYLAGEISGASKAKPNFSVDIKINTPFLAKRPEARFFFDLKANSNSEADPDSLNLGFEYARNQRAPQWLKKLFGGGKPLRTVPGLENCISGQECIDPRSQPNDLITQINYSLSAKIESDREFDNTNFIASGMVTLPFAKFSTGQRIEFNTFVGGGFRKKSKKSCYRRRRSGDSSTIRRSFILCRFSA